MTPRRVLTQNAALSEIESLGLHEEELSPINQLHLPGNENSKIDSKRSSAERDMNRSVSNEIPLEVIQIEMTDDARVKLFTDDKQDQRERDFSGSPVRRGKREQKSMEIE